MFYMISDVNECLYDGFCDQLCTDLEFSPTSPGYECHCAPGFTNVTDSLGNPYCHAINGK